MADPEWVLLAYRLPREPSTPRIAVWRKLRKLGAVQLVDGLVALPADAATVEAFDWLADEVVEAGAEAWAWQARAGGKQQHNALRGRGSGARRIDRWSPKRKRRAPVPPGRAGEGCGAD